MHMLAQAWMQKRVQQMESGLPAMLTECKDLYNIVYGYDEMSALEAWAMMQAAGE